MRIIHWIKETFLEPKNVLEPLVWLRRKETWHGDVKANRIRLLGLVVFAVNELINFYHLHAVDQRFHKASMTIIGLWGLVALVYAYVLRRHYLPRLSPYLMVTADICFLSWLLLLADGPKSPLVAVYFLIIALSGIRLNPALVLFSTAMSVYCYGSLLWQVKISRPEQLIASYHIVIVVLALLLLGAIMAHLITRVFELMNELMKKGGTHA